MGDAIIKYWTQIVFILLALGYLIQQGVGLYIKKKEIMFTALHQERAKIIKQLHTDLVKLNFELGLMSLAHFLNESKVGSPTKSEWNVVFQDIVQLQKKISTEFAVNKIYFPQHFEKKIEQMLDVLQRGIMTPSLNSNLDPLSEELVLNDTPKFKLVYEPLFKVILNTLEKEFRKYL